MQLAYDVNHDIDKAGTIFFVKLLLMPLVMVIQNVVIVSVVQEVIRNKVQIHN